MNEKKKKRVSALGCVGRIAAVAAVAAVAVVLVLNYALGTIIEKAAPQVGPMVLGTQVSVSNATARLLSGRVGISGLVVGAPEGFDANVFEMEDFRFELDVSSLRGGPDDPVVIREIVVKRPVVTYELKGLHDNLHALLDRIGAGEKKEKESAGDDAEKAPGRKVAIERFLFEGGRVRVAVVGGKGAVVPLPTIELTGIGTKSGGVTALEAVGQILQSITVGTVAAAKDVLLDLGGAAVDAAAAVGGVAADAVGAVGNAAADAVGGVIGAIFGGSGEDSAKPGEDGAESSGAAE